MGQCSPDEEVWLVYLFVVQSLSYVELHEGESNLQTGNYKLLFS